jgi:predicted transcriptional regulator
MKQRHLTITVQPDWKSALRTIAKKAEKNTYQGEILNFESPAQFFGKLSENRWNIIRAAQGRGEMALRQLAREVKRDVKRVHEDVGILVELGLLERTESGGVICPYSSLHIDMRLHAA